MSTANELEILKHLRDMTYKSKVMVLDTKEVLRGSQLWSISELEEAHATLNDLTDVVTKLSKAESLFHNKLVSKEQVASE